jgi:hypothetical protein
MVVMGLFDIGRAVFYYAVLNSAVREGTRFAIVQPYCDYRANPAACTGEFVDLYPVNCADAQSLANTNICSEITEKYFNISELSDATIVIDHCISTTDEPMVEIDIVFLFKPITPGLSLIGDLTIHVNSHMLLAPIALQ